MERRAYHSPSTAKGYNTNGSPDRAQLDLLRCRPGSISSSSPDVIDSGYSSPTASAMSMPLRIRRALPRGGRKPHVCVVGAGVSGLRCADVLVKAGMRVTVLEARGRVGGRVS